MQGEVTVVRDKKKAIRRRRREAYQPVGSR